LVFLFLVPAIMPAMTKSHICRICRAQTHQQITLVAIVTTKAGIFMCLAAETAMPPGTSARTRQPSKERDELG
jgi:hypothetical protein